MLDPRNEQKFLKWLSDEYIRRFGYGIRNIDKCDFLTSYSVSHLPEWLYSVSGNVAKSHVIHWAKELEAKGLVRFSENGYQFYFTKTGYEAVSRSWIERFQISLNRNPGLISLFAAIVSLGSLVVAVFALLGKGIT